MAPKDTEPSPFTMTSSLTREQILAMARGLDDAIELLGPPEKDADVLYDAIGKLRDLALSALDRQGWISVEESLPENGVRVLIWWKTYGNEEPYARIGYHVNGHWRPEGGNGNFDDMVDHWMPLPPAPHASAQINEPPQVVSSARTDASTDGLDFPSSLPRDAHAKQSES